MADRLNWMPTYVKAVEEDQFEVLRGDAFVRGYLRAYARQVDLSEDDIVAAYEAMQPANQSGGENLSGASTAGTGMVPGGPIAIGIAVALLVVAGFWWSQQESEPRRPRPAATPVETTVEAPSLSEPAIEPPQAELPSEEVAESTGLVAEVAEEEFPEPVIQTSLSSSGEEAGVELVAVEAFSEESPAEPEPLFDADLPRLDFSFSGDCWVEVRDGNAELIYADLRGAGDQFSLNGQPPFEVLLGDANVVELRYQDEPFPIAIRPGRMLARFNVGEQ
jgi:cytoskeleton protein RodZ